MKTLVALLLKFLLAFLVAGSAWAEFNTGEMDTWLRDTSSANEPGATVIAIKDGEVVFKGGYGMANLELGVPLETDMVLRLGSMTKQFTATAIMLLEQEGKLSVSDDITKHLPDYNIQGRTITIEHLLTHTSGIPDIAAQPDWGEQKRTPATNENMFGFLQDLPLEFEPGERFQYSNSGYWMLGAIVAAVSGMTYQEFVEERIFKALGMNSSFHDRQQRVIPRRASGYWNYNCNLCIAAFMDMSRPGAAGALASSVEDLALWDASLYTEQLLPAEAWQRMWTPFTLNNGQKSMYGYGWNLSEHNGSPVISHNGSINGFWSDAYRMPDQKLYVVVLSNGPMVNPGTTAQRLMLSLLGEDVKFEPIEMAMEELKQYQGIYRISEDNTRTVTVDVNGIYTQRPDDRKYRVRPLGNDRFLYINTLDVLQFHRNTNGDITHQEIWGLRYAANRAERTDEPLPEPLKAVEIDPAILEDYAGEYEFRPGLIVKVWDEGGKLITQATGQEAIEFYPGGDDVFFNESVGTVYTFRRNEEGHVTGVLVEYAEHAIEADKG